MRKIILAFALTLCATLPMFAQDQTSFSSAEQEMIDISNAKWQWMSEKNVDKLADLFHDSAQFVHMGGYSYPAGTEMKGNLDAGAE